MSVECKASCIITIFCLIVVLAIALLNEHSRVSTLRGIASRRQETLNDLRRELNRVRLSGDYDRELYQMDLGSMREEIETYLENISALESALRKKNAEIVRLKKEIREGGDKQC